MSVKVKIDISAEVDIEYDSDAEAISQIESSMGDFRQMAWHNMTWTATDLTSGKVISTWKDPPT